MATAVVAAIAGWLSGWHGAWSGILGGFVNVSAGIVFGMLARVSSPTAVGTVRTVLRAQAAKITVIVLQLGLTLTMYKDVVHGAFFGAFVATLLVTQAAILIRD
jgi:ATP synthase protein I